MNSSFITAIAASSTSQSGTPSGFSKPASNPSVGSKGDSYDNALAETIIGLYKTEVIQQGGPWRGLEDVEFATLEWVWWFNHKRLLELIGYIPPVEHEEAFYSREQSQTLEAVLN